MKEGETFNSPKPFYLIKGYRVFGAIAINSLLSCSFLAEYKQFILLQINIIVSDCKGLCGSFYPV